MEPEQHDRTAHAPKRGDHRRDGEGGGAWSGRAGSGWPIGWPRGSGAGHFSSRRSVILLRMDRLQLGRLDRALGSLSVCSLESCARIPGCLRRTHPDDQPEPASENERAAQSSRFADQHARGAGERRRYSVSCGYFASTPGSVPRKCHNGRAFEAETKHAEIVRQIQDEIEEQSDESVSR